MSFETGARWRIDVSNEEDKLSEATGAHETKGLTSEDVKTRRAKFGWNESPEQPRNELLLFLKKFTGLTSYMLELIIILALALKNWLNVRFRSLFFIIHLFLLRLVSLAPCWSQTQCYR